MIDITKLFPRIVHANPELAVKLAWSRAAGEGLRLNTNPVRFAANRLIVSVADALWQRQLESMRAELIFRMNKLLGEPTIKELVFRIVPSDLPAQPHAVDAPPAKRPKALPTELLFAAGSIADEDLRARFLRAADNLIDRRDSQATED
jgi:Dna[CI] antecedent DciA-like protein